MSKIVFILISILFFIREIKARHTSENALQTSINRITPDSAWHILVDIQEEMSRVRRDTNKLRKECRLEEYARMYLERGKFFWETYPADTRRYRWLCNTMASSPNFWLDINAGAKARSESEYYASPVDWKYHDDWETWKAKNISVYLNDTSVHPAERKGVFLTNFMTEMELSKNAEYRKSKEHFLGKVQKMFDQVISNPTLHSNGTARRTIESLFTGVDNLGLTINDLKRFINSYLGHYNAEIRLWAEGKKTLLDLSDIPLELEMKSVKGSLIKLSKLRGKVVLLDFWNTGCSICISRMPAIKGVYDKYKESGFEVISICTEPETSLDKVKKIEERLKTTWPVAMIGGKDNKENNSQDVLFRKIWKRFGFTWVPQLLLLDKQGKLVKYNGVLINGDFEPIVKKLLEEAYSVDTVRHVSENFDLKKFEAEEDYKNFQHIIKMPFSEAYKTYTEVVKYYTGRTGSAGIFSKEDFENRSENDSLKMVVADQTYKVATQTYIKNTILWICQHPDALLTPKLIAMWWPKEDWASAYEKLTPRIQQSFYGKELLAYINKEKHYIKIEKKQAELAVGKRMPDFRISSPEGKVMNVLEIASKANYTLIDFWASWCVPCRSAIPQIKEVYDEYYSKGFNVLGISIDKREADWKEALLQDSTIWVHGIDNIDGAGKNIFGLAAIPAYILLDRNGTIIDTDYFSGRGGFKILKPGEKTLSANLREIIKEKCQVK